MTTILCSSPETPAFRINLNPRRRALAPARIAAMFFLAGAAAFPQTLEPTYISDLTSAIAGIFSGNITLAGTPLPRVKFAAHDLPASGAYLNSFTAINPTNCPASTSSSYTSWTSACPLKAYTDGLVSMGVDRININIWVKPYANGTTATQLLYANLVNYIHAQTCNLHTCEVELDPADLSLTEITTCGTITDMSDYQTCLTTTTTAMVTMATDTNYTLGQPDHFTIVHECSTMNGRFGWDGVSAGQGTASDWRGFVDTVAGKLSAASYTGRVGAGGCLYWEDGQTTIGGHVVPNFCGDSTYGFNGDSANLKYITYDVYNALSTTGPATYAANMLTRTSGTNPGANYAAEIAATVAAGWTDVRIEESGNPPFVYGYDGAGTANLTDTEPNTTQDSYRGCGWNDWNTYGTDRQWLDMIFKFASAQKMTSVAIFYTFPFFAYTTSLISNDCNPTALYTSNVVSNSLGSISATGTYFASMSANWPTVIATGSVELTGSAKLQ